MSDEPHTRLRLFCSPHHQDHALYPTIAQFERAAGFRREDTADERLEKLEAVLAKATNDLGEAASLLAALLSLPTGERYPPLNLTPQKQKEKTLQSLVAQVEGLAARQPVLMVFEDVDWSDPTSLELLDLLIDLAPDLPLLLIVTFRPEFAPPWTGRPHVTLLAISRLTPRQRAEKIARVTGGKALPEEMAKQIVDRTDGVPLFVEELTKAVVESGMLIDAGDRYTVAEVPGSGQVRPGDATAATGRRSGAAGQRGTDLPARYPARRRIHFQACSGAGRRLRHPAAQPPSAAPRPHRGFPRKPVSGDCRGSAGIARASVRGSRADGEGGRLLAVRRAAGLGARDARRSRGIAPARAGAGSCSA